MKHASQRIITIFFFAVTASLAHAQNFEGVVHLSMNDFIKGENSEIIWKMKGDRHALFYSSKTKGNETQYKIIANATDTRAKILAETNGQKVAYDAVIPVSEEKMPYIKHTYTGKTKNIAGFDAEEIILIAADKTTVCFVAKTYPLKTEQLPVILKSNPVMGYLIANKINALPLEIITTSNTGKELFNQIIHSINSEIVSIQEFSTTGYISPLELLNMQQRN